MRDFAEAYLEPATDVLGSEGVRVAAWRFCCHLSFFATAHATGYRPADTIRRIRQREAVEAIGAYQAGSPFTTITTRRTGYSTGGI